MATAQNPTCRRCGEPDETVAPIDPAFPNNSGLCLPCELAAKRGWELDDGGEFACEDRYWRGVDADQRRVDALDAGVLNPPIPLRRAS